jgi:hypothetical protein
MRYLEWDFDNDLLIEYERLGECNGCGQCCKAVIHFTAANFNSPVRHNPRNGGPTTDNQGVWTAVMNEQGQTRFFKITAIEDIPDHACGRLTDDNRCRIQTGKPRICTAWPISPSQVAPFGQCSYTFREIERWKISEPEQGL